MNALLTPQSTARTNDSANANPLLKRGAIRLDLWGRMESTVRTQGETPAGTDSGRLRTTSFTEHLDPCQRQRIEKIYIEGVRAGQLYEFVDTTIQTPAGPRAISMLLYFHEATGQGWLFVEPQSSQNTIRELALAV